MTQSTSSPRQRLPYDAISLEHATQYFETRARQFLHEGYVWSGAVNWVPGLEGKACQTQFEEVQHQKVYNSFYILAAARGQGLMSQLISRGPILTTRSCNIEELLARKGADYKVIAPLLDSVEYRLIQDWYADQVAKRTQLFLMNHIDEGMAIMRMCGADDQALRAFCLHPLLQNDADIAVNFDRVARALRDVPDGAIVIAYAMEYRSVANEYLAKVAMPANGIRLSPLEPVNHMLRGDKVQNRRDFLRTCHAQNHPDRVRLAEYFQQWCERLGISEARYARLTQAISLRSIT